MRVSIVDKRGQPFCLAPGIGTEGVVDEYINKKTGLPDPRVIFDTGRFLHVDTIRNNGGFIKNLDEETTNE